jgi:hypothetical protein
MPHLAGSHFSWENYEHNNQYDSIEYFEEQAKTRQVWQIPFVNETWDEDNNTDSESDSDSSDEDQLVGI